MYAVLEVRKLLPLVAIAAFLSLCTLSLLVMSQQPDDGAITEGVRIFGLDVGGLTSSEAKRYVEPYLREVVAMPISLFHGYRRWRIYPARLGVEPDIEAMIESAWSIGREGGLFRRWWNKANQDNLDVPMKVRIQGKAFERALEDIAAEVNQRAIDASFVPNGVRVHILPARSGIKVEESELKAQVLNAAKEIENRTVQIPTSTVEPQLSTEAARDMGIEMLIAQFSTTFDRREVNRATNIYLAADALRGAIIAPRQEFSFNGYVGPRLESAGYKPAPVIVDGELQPDIGGGVCQVSTTLYNAVLLAGFEVTCRYPHSIPVTYVPLGQDAAVAYDYIDLKFINNRPEHIMVWSTVEGDQITVSIYGRARPEFTVKVESQINETLQPGVQRILDPTLPQGVERIEYAGSKGYRVTVWRSLYQGGVLKRRERVNETTYEPRDVVIRYGKAF